ncbi:MAG: DNA repair protein RecO [Actinomycetia bacterium]|nr:DNA repair protein RecO [Actinomycetes bacterium]MCP4958723.1 DNA repair protein RecO [Actinomycetes bacterium]
MALYRDRGIVLRTYKLGEADRIVSIITEERGKVRAVAKGVRKTKSRFGGRLEPTGHLALQLYEGRELDIVTQVESIQAYRHIREDLDRLSKAIVLLEAVDHLAHEGSPAPHLYRMLAGALAELDRSDSAMLVPAFLLKLLAAEGFGPDLDVCVVGGKADADLDLVALDIDRNGAVCIEHRRGVPVSTEAFAVMRAVMGGGLKDVLDVAEGPVTHEVDALVGRMYEHHVERRLRSAHVLDRA